MSRLAEIHALFPVGSEVHCDENTLIPAHVGRRIKITKRGATFAEGTQMGKPGVFHLRLPTRITHVDHIEHAPDLIRYQITNPRFGDGHFVTWREVS